MGPGGSAAVIRFAREVRICRDDVVVHQFGYDGSSDFNNVLNLTAHRNISEEDFRIRNFDDRKMVGQKNGEKTSQSIEWFIFLSSHFSVKKVF